MGDNFLSKSFLFEIVDSNTEDIESSFTLVLPPNAYTIKEPHRVSITKTFGNAFIDDYGPDNIQLIIKGISGTAHVFPTFRTSGSSRGFGTIAGAQQSIIPGTSTEGYRHREAFYTFRDEIMRYKSNFLDSFDQKELRVYDLADEQAYKCALLEFTLDRNADKPFHYPFEISLFVYAKLGSKDAFDPKKIEISKNPLIALAKILGAVSSLPSLIPGLGNIISMVNAVSAVGSLATIVRNRINSAVTTGRELLESPLTLSKELISAAGTLSKVVDDARQQGKILEETYANAAETIEDQYRQAFGVYGFAIEEGSQQSKTNFVPSKTGINYNDPTSPSAIVNNTTFTFSGVNTYTIKGGDTLQRIAQTQLGDSNLWWTIASVNRTVASNADLVVGEEIYVPIQTTSTGDNKDSFILTEDTLRNPYGSDIRVDANGSMIIESNDVVLVSGVDNVLQAIDTRLKTRTGTMIKQTAFGLAAQPGLAGTPQAAAYTRMSLTNALIKDPRIASVGNVQVSVQKDQLIGSADIRLVGREESLPVQVVVN